MDFVGKRHWFFLVSFVVVVASVASLVVPGGLNTGLEFRGGSSMTLEFAEQVQQEDIRAELSRLGHPEAVIQQLDDRSYFLRTRLLEESEGGGASERERIVGGLEAGLGTSVESSDLFSVSPSIASETVRNAIIIVVIASVAIMVYITWAFRRVPSPFRYGLSAIIALIHDVVVVLGVYSILGRIFGFEVDALFIAGILTVIGYSVNDTIVVFDRIRENIIRGIGRDLGSAINVSIQDTLGRSFNTSLTLMFAILALLLFGGPTIRDFLVVLLIGVIVGTYSSIWIASQALLSWESGDAGKLFRRLPLPFGSRS